MGDQWERAAKKLAQQVNQAARNAVGADGKPLPLPPEPRKKADKRKAKKKDGK